MFSPQVWCCPFTLQCGKTFRVFRRAILQVTIHTELRLPGRNCYTSIPNINGIRTLNEDDNDNGNHIFLTNCNCSVDTMFYWSEIYPVLNSVGMVSSLFNRDEQSEIVSELIPVMKREHPRRPLTPENVMDFFLTRTRQNLHVVLCFSPVSIPVPYIWPLGMVPYQG